MADEAVAVAEEVCQLNTTVFKLMSQLNTRVSILMEIYYLGYPKNPFPYSVKFPQLFLLLPTTVALNLNNNNSLSAGDGFRGGRGGGRLGGGGPLVSKRWWWSLRRLLCRDLRGDPPLVSKRWRRSLWL